MSRGRPSDERGAYLVLFAILIVALMAMVAVVIDLAALRQDRANNRKTTDAAATSAAGQLLGGGNAVSACQAAWDYFIDNTEDEGTTLSPPDCAASFGGTCVPTAARVAVGTAGAYTVRIVNPVPNSHELMTPNAIGNATQAINDDHDGEPDQACDRVAVGIEQHRAPWFAQIIGWEGTTTNSHSVARRVDEEREGELVALLLLEPEACNALATGGNNTQIDVRSVGERPGIIWLDSAGTRGSGSNDCRTGTRYVVDTNNTPGLETWKIRAQDSPSKPGLIKMYAIGIGNTVRAYEPADVSSGRLTPVPTAADERATPAPVYHRYNCKDGYAAYLGTVPIADCDDPTDPNVDQLVAALDGTGDTPPANGETWYVYPDDLLVPPLGVPFPADPDATCNLGAGANVLVPRGNWFVKCAPLDVSGNGAVLVFEGGKVVTKGGISASVNATLTFNGGAALNDADGDDPAWDSIVFMRAGNFTKGAQASITLDRTFVYQKDGVISFAAGSGALTWIAPNHGDFEDLGLWSEKDAGYLLGGQAALTLEGVLFTPHANPFTFSGQPGLNQTKAQFITRRLFVDGNGKLVMQPDPDRAVFIKVSGVRLIR